MKQMRFDDPKSNPSLKVDGKLHPRRDHRALRADAADPIRDAQDVTAARRDAALDGVREQHKVRRGYSRADLREAQTKPEAAPKPAMDADAARQAAHASIKAASRKGGK